MPCSETSFILAFFQVFQRTSVSSISSSLAMLRTKLPTRPKGSCMERLVELQSCSSCLLRVAFPVELSFCQHQCPPLLPLTTSKLTFSFFLFSFSRKNKILFSLDMYISKKSHFCIQNISLYWEETVVALERIWCLPKASTHILLTYENLFQQKWTC